MSPRNALQQNRHGRRRIARGPIHAHGAERDDRELARRYRSDGDTAARNELIERLMPLAHMLARRYQRPNVALDDLVQVAGLGLVKAVDRFDPDQGTALSSYAVPTILGELKRYFRDSSWAVHVPRDMQERVLRVNQTIESLSYKLGRSPTPAEVATDIGETIEYVLEAMEATSAYESISLDAAGDGPDEEAEPHVDRIGFDDDRFELVEDAAGLAPRLRDLPERERLVLGLRFVEDMTQSQIAKRVGVSQMHVSRLIERGLNRVRSERQRGLQAPVNTAHS